MGASATTLASVTLSQLIDDVARPEPTPGGGAVAAIVASLAGALAAMAGHYAVRRAPDVGELRDLVERAVHVAADAAADVPLQIARAAREIAELGERLAVSGAPALRSDACTATLLASAVAASAAILVGENLRKRPEDPRVTEAGRCAAQAAMAARNVVAPFDHLRSDAS
jgi:glutamate formiminotransferase/glutamate formiminotransferase/formiminotetrahydrofolate cyclodeaminase